MDFLADQRFDGRKIRIRTIVDAYGRPSSAPGRSVNRHTVRDVTAPFRVEFQGRKATEPNRRRFVRPGDIMSQRR